MPRGTGDGTGSVEEKALGLDPVQAFVSSDDYRIPSMLLKMGRIHKVVIHKVVLEINERKEGLSERLCLFKVWSILV